MPAKESIVDPVIHSGHPRSFGYMRRKELERRGGGQVWEAPDGTLTEFQRGAEPVLYQVRL